jgi:aminopeptidase-like protein
MKFPMIKWAKNLFPINRSLTGEGNRKTINFFKNLNPEFKSIKFKSGKKVFDWNIPNEWNVKDAFIEHESGKRFAEFKKNTLHLVGYSIPINKIFNRKEIFKKIFTQKDQPSAIPYVTSYYNKNWGFCMSENQKKKMPKGKYRAYINSELKKGELEMIHSIIKGKQKKEIFFSSYFCHPSMANNELSGPVLLNAIMLYIKSRYKNPEFTYRFVLLPETIGSIAYISKFKNILKKNIICGFVLTCVGDERAYSLVHTPSSRTLADEALKCALANKKNFIEYSYLDRGSDERQYCYPGVDLPVCSFSRSKTFPEYHTDKDDFNLVTQKGLEQSFEVMKNIIDACEVGLFPKNVYICEPQLGKRNLYTTNFSKKNTYKDELFIRKNILAYANGKRSIFEISNLIKKPLNKTVEQYKILKEKKVIK